VPRLILRVVPAFNPQLEYVMALLVVLILSAALLLIFHLYHQSKLSKLQNRIPEIARSQFEEWRRREYETVCAEQRQVAKREADAAMQEWKITYEAGIRADAIMRSQAVITGKVTENIIPYMPVFPYNPKDVRFIGSPVDLIVFDGAAEGCLRDVIFLEVKTGGSSLNQIQRQIRDAVLAGRVEWRELRVVNK
jgi:predicted Holliday junction resolvase-like endonuclease